MWTETETKFIALENEIRNGFHRHRDNEGMVAFGMGLVCKLVLVLDRELLHPKDNKGSQYNSRSESRSVAIPNAKVVPAEKHSTHWRSSYKPTRVLLPVLYHLKRDVSGSSLQLDHCGRPEQLSVSLDQVMLGKSCNRNLEKWKRKCLMRRQPCS